MTVDNQDKLSTKEQWDAKWSSRRRRGLSFNYKGPMFRDVHALLVRSLPEKAGMSFLEVGSFPGSYLWYFSSVFGYNVCGIEYIAERAEQARRNLESAGVDGEIIHADFFEYRLEGRPGWDVVFSSGFIEHFEDTRNVVSRHIDLVKPGGFVALVIPNHKGIYGRIMKAVDPEKHAMHNLMTYDDMVASVRSDGRCSIIAGGYCGRLGLWNTCLYETAAAKGPVVHKAVRAPGWLIERIGRILPNSVMLSPNAVLIAQKTA